MILVAAVWAPGGGHARPASLAIARRDSCTRRHTRAQPTNSHSGGERQTGFVAEVQGGLMLQKQAAQRCRQRSVSHSGSCHDSWAQAEAHKRSAVTPYNRSTGALPVSQARDLRSRPVHPSVGSGQSMNARVDESSRRRVSSATFGSPPPPAAL